MVPPDGGACPAEPTCQENTLVSCGPDAGVQRTECGAARCASDAPVPRCVPATALPCDAGDPALRCENGRIVDCAADTLYYLARSCGSGQLCVGEDTPRCIAIAEVSCNADFWTPLCVDGERLSCTRQGRLEAVAADCESG